MEEGTAAGIIRPEMEREDVRLITGERVHVSYNSGETEWYTPPAIIKLARAVMGNIDLDPASSLEANKVVRASRFYSLEDNGLEKPWAGRVWLNPPYAEGLVGKFTQKLTLHIRAGEVREAIALVNNATETGWFQDVLCVASGVCFPKGRVRFWQPGEAEGTPLQGQAVVYFGSRFSLFHSVFSRLGVTLPGKVERA